MPRTDTLITMSPKARRALAREFFIEGFKLSGQGMNGETVDVDQPNAVRDLLLIEFDRVYAERVALLEALGSQT